MITFKTSYDAAGLGRSLWSQRYAATEKVSDKVIRDEYIFLQLRQYIKKNITLQPKPFSGNSTGSFIHEKRMPNLKLN